MKALLALIYREFLEHRGAFLVGPLILVGVLFGATILAFTVGRMDVRFSGSLFTITALRLHQLGFLGLALGWQTYLAIVLVFYCADGFAADRRNNAMLFWKSMPVSDFKILFSKLLAGLTILPGTIYAITLLSGALMFAVSATTMSFVGAFDWPRFIDLASVYGQVAVAMLFITAYNLLWYVPFAGLVGGLAALIGRWAVPATAFVLTLLSVLEWVSLGGLHPFDTRIWDYLHYRFEPPLFYILDSQIITDPQFSPFQAASQLWRRIDWLQMGLGIALALAALYLASQYRRRAPAN